MPAVGHTAWTHAGDVSTLTRGIHTALFLNRLTGMTDLDEWLPGGQRLIDATEIDSVRSK